MNLYKAHDKIKGVLLDSYPNISEKHIQFSQTRKDVKGDLTLVLFPFLKLLKTSPDKIGAEMGQKIIQSLELFAEFEVVGGFLNLSYKKEVLLDYFSVLEQQGACVGTKPESKQSIIVEYASPNTNKPLHLGHVRNVLLGYSVSEILKTQGHSVIKTQIINDRGIHICKSMLAWQIYGQNKTPEDTGQKGDKLVGDYYVKFNQVYTQEIAELISGGMDEKTAKEQAPILLKAREMLKKWEAGDKEVVALWQKMNDWVYKGFDATYEKIGVNFDTLYYESNTYLFGKKVIEEGLEKKIFYKKQDGSVWCDLTAEGLDEKLVLRADGTAVYMTQDIGTAIQRFKDYPSTSKQVYTVGNEQDYHFKVLFLILQKLGYSWAKDNYHLSYGMMELPSGKMKSREGTVVDADDLMDEMYLTAKAKCEELGKLDDLDEQQKEKLYLDIGLGALKYFILKVDPKKKMLFNPEESIDFNGDTGPFVQYTHARCSAIIRTANQMKIEFSSPLRKEDITLESSEREVLKLMVQFTTVLEEAAQKYAPSLLASYLFDLAKSYNRFYQSVSIFKEENLQQQHLRIRLTISTALIIKRGLKLLGISAPSQM